MYIYQTGIISEAVHTKIENAKNSVRGGERSTQSFGELIRSMMTDTSAKPKPVRVTNVTESTSPIASADGRTLLYALTNADTDSTASAVIGALGLPISDTGIKAAADGLSAAAELLAGVQGSDKDTLLPALTDFVDRYNTLMSDLRAQTTASGIIYARLFSTAAKSASDALAKAGITVSDNGTLTLDTQKLEEVGLEGFIGSITTAADAVSTYASSITGSQSSSLLDFLGNDDTTTSDYYSTLINTMS